MPSNPVHAGPGSGPRRYGNCGTRYLPNHPLSNQSILISPSPECENMYTTVFDIVMCKTGLDSLSMFKAKDLGR